MKNRCVQIACILSLAATLPAAELIPQSHDPKQWSGVVKPNTKDVRTDKATYELSGKYPTELLSAKAFPVDPKKAYTLSTWFKSQKADLPASGYMGFRMYDEKGRNIYICHVCPLAGTESRVISAKKGEKTLLVEKNPNWLKQKVSVVAFNAQKGFKDLPNYDLSSQVKKVTEQNGNFLVQLAAPLAKDYPAGTPIRLHSPWGAPMYFLAEGWMPADQWKQFSRTVRGIAPTGAPANQFWAGTKTVRVMIWFGNWNRIPKAGAKLLVDGISLQENDK